ncbi:hypothetical protein AB6A40_005606 [Gnathostoma spinigerum]|uniref:Vitellogenin n=1 Tax=Gnathostoma spinigerum TaxID=75299 RepID=A0ABD6EI40_9BILA
MTEKLLTAILAFAAFSGHCDGSKGNRNEIPDMNWAYPVEYDINVHFNYEVETPINITGEKVAYSFPVFKVKIIHTDYFRA